MKYTYLFLFLLTIIVGATLYGVFSVNGFPSSQQAIARDRERLNNFSTISYRIQDYFTTNKALPSSLEIITENQKYPDTTLRLTDPETKKPYEYHTKSAYSYELCTTFSADYKDQQRSSSGPYTYYISSDVVTKVNYKKGHACIQYNLPKYLYEVTPTSSPFNYQYTSPPTPTPTPISEVRSPTSGTIVCSEHNFNITWFSKGKGMHTVSITLVSPENIARTIGSVNIPHEGDLQMLDQYTWNVPSSVSSLKLPKEYGYYLTIADTLNGKTLATTGEKFEIRNCEG